MRTYLYLIFCLIGFTAYGQSDSLRDSSPNQGFTTYPVMHLGYQYSNGNYLQLGVGLYNLHNQSGTIFPISLDAQVAYFKDALVVIPELNAGILFNLRKSKADPYSENFNAGFYLLRMGISPYSITPKIGISILELLDLYAGYAINFNEHPKTKPEGICFGLRFTAPFQLFTSD